MLRHEFHHNICVFSIEHMDKVGSLLDDHHIAMHKWKGSFSPKVVEKIVTNMEKSQTCPTHVYMGGSIKVSIERTYLDVDLKSRSCTCKAWQMSGITCDDTCATKHRLTLDISDYVDECFKLTSKSTLWNNHMQLEVYFSLAISMVVLVSIVFVIKMMRNEGFRWIALFLL